MCSRDLRQRRKHFVISILSISYQKHGFRIFSYKLTIISFLLYFFLFMCSNIFLKLKSVLLTHLNPSLHCLQNNIQTPQHNLNIFQPDLYLFLCDYFPETGHACTIIITHMHSESGYLHLQIYFSYLSTFTCVVPFTWYVTHPFHCSPVPHTPVPHAHPLPPATLAPP